MAVGVVDRLEAIQIHIEQRKRLAVLFQHRQHPVKITLVQQTGQAIGVGKALQQVLLAHILRDHHHAGQAVALPRHGNHCHHEKRTLVAGSIFQLEGVVVRFDQPAQVFRGQHLGDLGVFAVGQHHILARYLLQHLPVGALRRVHWFSAPLVVLVTVSIQIAHRKTLHNACHACKHHIARLPAALQLPAAVALRVTLDLYHTCHDQKPKQRNDKDGSHLHPAHAGIHHPGRHDADDAPIHDAHRLIDQVISLPVHGEQHATLAALRQGLHHGVKVRLIHAGVLL